MKLDIGYAGKPHFTAENWADINRGIIGSDAYVFPVGRQFESELITNNLLKIYDGCGCMQGRSVSIPRGQADEITIENGTQGEKRIDLIVIRYQKNADTGIETAEPKIIKGTPSEKAALVPAHIIGDIRGGDLITDWPLYEIHLEGISVVEVTPLFNVLMSVSELNRNFKESVYADGYMVVDIGALPNNSTKSVPANIPSAASEYWISDAWCKSRTTGQVSPMPYIDASTWSNAIGITISASKNIVVTTKADWSAYSGKAVIAYKLSFI